MVLIFSNKANASKHVLREVELGTKREIILLPFRVEDVEPTGPMEFFLAGAQWHDAFEGPLEGHLGVLAGAVSKRQSEGILQWGTN